MAEPELKALGRYTIQRTLGKGAMGVVYEGLDPKLNRRVAIKTILKSHLDPDTAKEYSMRFSREAQAVARLNHPHIVQVYDFAEEGEIAYLVMEFIRGKELKTFFDANERFEIKEVVRIMCELLDALEFAHNAGIIHRDIKPANVMLDSQGRTKLTDFGVARVQDVDRTNAEHTQAGTMVGTPAYMSPEQITGGSIDKRTDVFSAGIVLYQFLTGEKPFTGGGAWTIAKKIIQEEPPLPSSLNHAVTPHFDAVVNKALAKSPDTRYRSARDFAAALKLALEGKGESEDDTDRTVFGDLTVAAPAPQVGSQPRPAAAIGASGTQPGTQGGSQEVELEFWRAIKDGSDPDDFELYLQQFPNGIYAALARRKMGKLRGAGDDTNAESKTHEKREADEAARKEAEARVRLADEKEKLELELANKEEEFQRREAEQARARAEAEAKAKRESEALAQKQAEERAEREAAFDKREAELRKQAAGARTTSPVLLAGVAVAVLAVAIAGWYFLAPSDAQQQKKIAEIQKQLEAVMQQTAELEKAKKREEDARLTLEKARQAEEEAKKRGDLAKQKQLAEERARAEAEAKKTADASRQREAEAKKTADAAKAAQEKASATERAKAEKLAQDKAAAEKAAADKAIADAKAAADKAQADAEKAKREAEKTTVAAAPGGQALFDQALALEQQGKGTDAVKLYVRAARSGNGKAAKRLGEIYDKGIAGVSRDYAESLKWYNAARVLGEEVPLAKGR
jgi:eukaryotic-like serine/threonine-protein kinase